MYVYQNVQYIIQMYIHCICYAKSEALSHYTYILYDTRGVLYIIKQLQINKG